MASDINLMDLAQDILMMILRAYFMDVEVKAMQPSARLEREAAAPITAISTPILVNKALSPVASQTYLEQANFHFPSFREARQYHARPYQRSQHLKNVSGTIRRPAPWAFTTDATLKETFPKLS